MRDLWSTSLYHICIANKYDILVITESWLTSKISDDLIAMPGYVHVHKDRPDNHRGERLCTLFANNIRFFHSQNLDDPNFETQWFLLKRNQLYYTVAIQFTIPLETLITCYEIIYIYKFNPGCLHVNVIFKLKKLLHSPTLG